MKTPDKLTPELREAEKEVDNYYKSNPLVKFPFATAAWSLLAFAEDYMLKEQIGGIKAETHRIERNNGLMQHWFGHFKRKSIIVSKTGRARAGSALRSCRMFSLLLQ